MAMLFIICPVTGKATPTGIDVDENMNLDGFRNNFVQCIHCGQMHEWNGEDAFFRNDEN